MICDRFLFHCLYYQLHSYFLLFGAYFIQQYTALITTCYNVSYMKFCVIQSEASNVADTVAYRYSCILLPLNVHFLAIWNHIIAK